ncbi:NADH-quinone oxidoreductase subunit L [Cupriavidus metallidurans]|jgi:NADH-quinone oxidoreductase subunit L|uniref:NADH:ubiquinone oxidoreductase, membrane subunit L n=2 Tax=Cupriavidus metallidurans TaxID=119219 RepID=Q1LPV2_CUPMC|nr:MULTISPECIES: NADH-quinone oxidoreductase subunit L [Cupriavidus]PCH55545.1 MAG: NADH-quinone oxidoreductase subunit L [Burkholderiaceae bacterium]ABF07824.1 NADH:ubiquinone oxidoreductase, membrane subunit L [Cupriavidus metallidurans CH34]AVA33115.1 NADH-quinone oxidoreductase subunit L [Cupriavidus metallidurans]ELA00112.1 NADH:ubiquinone oxidoreductase subunit L [Cupriavidus sp. HMR-1]KWW36632.1 NADH-quinone oxidoreductase subunit L [Cupriavidus metallidurans]
MATTLNPNLLLAIPLAPLAGAAIAGLFGTKFFGTFSSESRGGRIVAHSATILGVAIAFVLSVMVLLDVLNGAGYNATVYEWMTIGSLKMEVGFLVDSLTAMMMVVVTFVSLMVHIYTVGYMEGDPGYNRFFAYISLFTFSMLMLVMSNNFLQLFFGWEAVGLVSYLLIGFWYTRPTAIFANLKAFLVNRVGDFGFILGIGLLLAYSGSMNYTDVFATREQLATVIFPGTDWMMITVACICLFIGAMGKSAQFPLHVWLPDSMEGPTPISALIHAATMVTAGIFMVARMSPLFELSDTALSFVLVIGAITALFMGFLGIIQNDIKRVVAYSTLSQLGYMTVALGASAYSVAVFHLMTHAFFKALLFLAAGSVIIGMHHDQDIRNMGGLRKYMPITWITSLVGSLALIGTPFFAGFYSKDSIIEAVAESHIAGSGFAYFAVLAGVFVTAFYSFRMYFLVFHGEERFGKADDHHGNHHDEEVSHDHHHGLAPGQKPHESPWVVTLPLVLLAIPSVIVGAIAIEPMLFGEFFKHGVAFKDVIFVGENHHAMEELKEAFHGWVPMAIHSLTTPVLWLAIAGVVLSWFFYMKRPDIPAAIKQRFSGLYKLLDNKYYMDAINEAVFARGARLLGTGLWKGGDQSFIDGLFVNGSARVVASFAAASRYLQSGYIYHYAFAMIIGMLVLLTLTITGVIGTK